MTTRSAALKQQIEAQLAMRIPGALSPVPLSDTRKQPLANTALSELLGGGIPVGAITEVYGNACSGRTSLAYSLLSAVTASGNVAAWVDVSDSLDPKSAALCGAELERLLWVRCGQDTASRSTLTSEPDGRQASARANTSKSTQEKPVKAVHIEPISSPVNPAHKSVRSEDTGSPHPRNEVRGMPAAIDALLQRKPYYAAIPERRAHRQIGTPGMPNRDITAVGKASGKLVPPSEIVPVHGSLFGRQVAQKPMPFPHASPYREEQIPTDRQPSRRARQLQPDSTTNPTPAAGKLHAPAPSSHHVPATDLWASLDQALRTVDLLLQAGGFSLVLLDLGSVPPQMAWRIPLATWFRFRAGCEHSRSSLLVISQYPCARASADLTLATALDRVQAAGETVAVSNEYRLHVEQQRRSTAMQADSNVVSFRKPVRPEHGMPGWRTWSAASTWGVCA